MSRWIDADEFRRCLQNYRPYVDSGRFNAIQTEVNQVLDCIEYEIEEAPSIEPKRGEWIEFDIKWGRSLYYCTNCMETSEVPTTFGKPLYNFCPNCGADMRKGADDEL